MIHLFIFIIYIVIGFAVTLKLTEDCEKVNTPLFRVVFLFLWLPLMILAIPLALGGFLIVGLYLIGKWILTGELKDTNFN